MKLGHLTKKRRSQLSERELAEKIGGKVQPASGALNVASFKGDVSNKHFLIDDKNTVLGSFSVNRKMLEKLRLEAFQAGRKHPVLRVKFDGGPAHYVISERLFLILNDALNNGLES